MRIAFALMFLSACSCAADHARRPSSTAARHTARSAARRPLAAARPKAPEPPRPEPDPVDRYCLQIARAKSEPLTVTAIHALSRLSDPRGVDVLLRVLDRQDGKAPQPLRIAAIQGLGRLRALRAAPVLHKLARDPKSPERAAALWSLRRICPSSQQIRFSLDIRPVQAGGPLRSWVEKMAHLKLRRILLAKAHVTAARQACRRAGIVARRPAPKIGFRVEAQVQVRGGHPRSSCRAEITISTAPGGTLRGQFSVKAMMDGRPTRLRLRQSIVGILDGLSAEIHRSLVR